METIEGPQSDDAVATAVEALRGDFVRKGHLGTEDVARIAEKRKLDLDQLNALLRALKAEGIVASDREPGQIDQGQASGAKRWRYLSGEEERRLANVIRLAQRLTEEGASSESLTAVRRDAERARDTFIECNQGLVRWIARRFYGRGLDFDDLVQEGMKGLIRAVEMFDPDLGYKFSTYATWWVRQSIGRGIDDTARAIRIPVHRLDSIRRLRKKRRQLTYSLGKEPTVAQLASQLDWSLEKTAFVADLAELRPVEIDGPLSPDSRETLENVFLRDPSPTPEETAVQADLRRNLEEVLAGLPVRTQDVIRRRFGLENGVPETLEMIGEHYGITRERIRQIEEKALKLLRKSGRSKHLKTFMDT